MAQLNSDITIDGSLTVLGGHPGANIVEYTEANRTSIARPTDAEYVIWISTDATAEPTNANTTLDLVIRPSDVVETTTSTSVASPVLSTGTKWTEVSSTVRKWGAAAMITVTVNRANVALSLDSEGDFPDERVATLIADCQGSVATQQYLGSTGSRVAAAYYTPSTGEIFITAAAGAGDAIDVGESVTLSGVVFLE